MSQLCMVLVAIAAVALFVWPAIYRLIVIHPSGDIATQILAPRQNRLTGSVEVLFWQIGGWQRIIHHNEGRDRLSAALTENAHDR